jgi:hypothetical protein
VRSFSANASGSIRAQAAARRFPGIGFRAWRTNHFCAPHKPVYGFGFFQRRKDGLCKTRGSLDGQYRTSHISVGRRKKRTKSLSGRCHPATRKKSLLLPPRLVRRPEAPGLVP